MFAEQLLDDLEPLLAVVALVAMVALFLHRSAVRYGETKGYGRKKRGLPDRTEWTCSSCDTHQDGSSRFCYACMTYATIADDPGTIQMMWFVGWLPASVVAVIGGTAATLIAWDLWPLVIVLVAGPFLGWLATLVFFYVAGGPWWRYGRGERMAALVVLASWLGAGPAVVIALATVVTLIRM